jgi:hypothetical protein
MKWATFFLQTYVSAKKQNQHLIQLLQLPVQALLMASFHRFSERSAHRRRASNELPVSLLLPDRRQDHQTRLRQITIEIPLD